MTDEKNTTPETAKPEPTLTNPVEQSFAEAERLAEQAEAAAKAEPVSYTHLTLPTIA